MSFAMAARIDCHEARLGCGNSRLSEEMYEDTSDDMFAQLQLSDSAGGSP